MLKRMRTASRRADRAVERLKVQVLQPNYCGACSPAAAEIGTGTKKRTCLGSVRRATAIAVTSVAVLFGLASCTTPFDMSRERITPLGPEWGLVIGSVLVQPEKVASDKNDIGRDVSGSSYEFDIVRIQPGDPNGEGPYVEQYRLDAKAGEERILISRLRSGQYLLRSFHEKGVTGLGGELDLVFASMAGEIRYIGRVLVEIPQRVSKGKGYRFTIENAREPTLAEVSHQHADLTKDVWTCRCRHVSVLRSERASCVTSEEANEPDTTLAELVCVRRLSCPVCSKRISDSRGEQQRWEPFRFSCCCVVRGFPSGSLARACYCDRRALDMTTPIMRHNSLGQVWSSRAPVFVLYAVLAFFCSGCLSLAVGVAGGAAGAVYVMGKLKDELNHDVPVVHKAAVAALADLELKLLEDKVDKLSAHVESEFADGEHVWIDLESLSDSRTRVTIRVGITGNEVRARKIYDAIKRHIEMR